MLTTGDGPQTSSVMIYNLSVAGERVEWNLMMACTLMAGIPPVIFYILSQRSLMHTFAVK